MGRFIIVNKVEALRSRREFVVKKSFDLNFPAAEVMTFTTSLGAGNSSEMKLKKVG